MTFADELQFRARFFNDSGIVSLNITNDTVDMTIHGHRLRRPGEQYIDIKYADGQNTNMPYDMFLLETEDYLNESFDIASKYFG
jgi:hypothetical protein